MFHFYSKLKMKILLTGATGYIGKRLLPMLLAQGHEVICCVRDRQRFPTEGIYGHPAIRLFEVDFLEEVPPAASLADIDVAYYLIHSMSDSTGDFGEMEARAATNFATLMRSTAVRQVIYLGGISNEQQLSRHLASRKNVSTILHASGLTITTLQAGIIVGSGSSSFEIMRDLVEKLPIMVTPRWLNTRCQPIAIRNVLEYLTGVLLREDTYNQTFDIGGPDIMTYKEMLLAFAAVRGLRRTIVTVPVMTPRLSSYWLYFVTATSYKLAVNLVNSMRVEVVASDNRLEQMLGIRPMRYREAVELAFQKIEQNDVVSSWKDALASSYVDNSLLDHINIPTNGCFIDRRERLIEGDVNQVLDNIWAIGGDRGWYYGNFLWQIRGFMDKFFGGVGLRRGRTNATNIYTGDTLDFWRVLAADKQKRRLLLYAEMILPGEAWLEFRIVRRNGRHYLRQTATYRPTGVLGRLYWYSVLPFHFFIFSGMLNNIIRYRPAGQVEVQRG